VASPVPQPPVTSHDIAAWVAAGLGLILVLSLHLLPSLLAGLLVYELVHILARRLHVWRLARDRSKLLAVAFLSVVIVTLLTLAIIGAIAFFRSDAGSLSGLMTRMANIIDSSRQHLPQWAAERIPANADALKAAAAQWLREHAVELQTIGRETGRAFAHILIGMIIGAIVSLREVRESEGSGPLARSLIQRATRLGEAFRRIVFAQVRISALNTLLTGIYLALLLPAFGVHLPLTKTLILITFVAGLLPVIGNLISNTIICIVSLSQSFGVAIASLVFLILIHKLEYFVNARIVGSQIRAAAWELLLAMLVMEAAFGAAGVIAAPIYYAYLKDELKTRGLL
jgi:predicted PurR-regulated permease PerM